MQALMPVFLCLRVCVCVCVCVRICVRVTSFQVQFVGWGAAEWRGWSGLSYAEQLNCSRWGGKWGRTKMRAQEREGRRGTGRQKSGRGKAGWRVDGIGEEDNRSWIKWIRCSAYYKKCRCECVGMTVCVCVCACLPQRPSLCICV